MLDAVHALLGQDSGLLTLQRGEVDQVQPTVLAEGAGSCALSKPMTTLDS